MHSPSSKAASLLLALCHTSGADAFPCISILGNCPPTTAPTLHPATEIPTQSMTTTIPTATPTPAGPTITQTSNPTTAVAITGTPTSTPPTESQTTAPTSTITKISTSTPTTAIQDSTTASQTTTPTSAVTTISSSTTTTAFQDQIPDSQDSTDCTREMCKIPLSSDFLLKYQVNVPLNTTLEICDNCTISMEAVYEGEAWVSIAFTTDRKMVGSEAVM
jgi:hypothetical protein